MDVGVNLIVGLEAGIGSRMHGRVAKMTKPNKNEVGGGAKGDISAVGHQ